MPAQEWLYNYYGLDASGNQLATYSHKLIKDTIANCGAGYSYGMFALSTSIPDTLDTLTLTITVPNSQQEVYILDTLTSGTFKEQIFSQVNGNVASKFTVEYFNSDSNILVFTSKVEGELNDGSFFNVKDSLGTNRSFLIKRVSGATDDVASCFKVTESKLKEHVIYANTRLGVIKHNKILNDTTTTTKEHIASITSGDRYYQINNWLGSVISVVKDMKYLENGDAPTITYSSSFETGDENIFTNGTPYDTSSAQVFSGNTSLVLDGQSNGGVKYGPTLKHLVKVGDTVSLNAQVYWESTAAGGGVYNRGGAIFYNLRDDAGNLLFYSNGTKTWNQYIASVSVWHNHPADQWNHAKPLKNWEVPQLYTDTSGTTPYTGTIVLSASPWSVHTSANKTYFDDINLTVSPAASNAEPYFAAVITEAHDYHEFGQLMEGRGFKGNYRYGYQGSEKDNEISGDGSSYTTQFRQLDPRLGRWMAPDPVFQPWQSPYTSMDNNPVNLTDVLGDKAGDVDNGVKDEVKSGEGASQAYERLSPDGKGGKRFTKKEFAEANSDKISYDEKSDKFSNKGTKSEGLHPGDALNVPKGAAEQKGEQESTESDDFMYQFEPFVFENDNTTRSNPEVGSGSNTPIDKDNGKFKLYFFTMDQREIVNMGALGGRGSKTLPLGDGDLNTDYGWSAERAAQEKLFDALEKQRQYDKIRDDFYDFSYRHCINDNCNRNATKNWNLMAGYKPGKGDTIIFVGKKGGFFGNEWSILAEYKNGLNGSDILVGDTAWGDVPDNFLEYAK